jgi:GalNAc-alpha-(1->4)-GalNAc-alpha-(1->3)-diNAcBac-PP-undecaprenol alpha-1,4-N-acetyl-D-galactosaminyltransferase
VHQSNFKICLVTPDLSPGGAERVIATIANNLAENGSLEIHILLLTGGNRFYKTSTSIRIHEPDFNYKSFARIISLVKIFFFVRKKLKYIKPNSLLSFGGRYNSFVLLASRGLQIRTYISDRSRPGISYGFLPDFLNPFAYKLATGIIAQTSQAKDYIINLVKHPSVHLIGNPIPNYRSAIVKKENIILNVGRFIKSKQQEMLIRIFASIDSVDWQLWLVGDGENLDNCKALVISLGLYDKVRFFGNQKDVKTFYQKASIFAFTSRSEGFPNSLGEAMSAGCACISFDCCAGPSDLIKDDKNGILVPLNDTKRFAGKLAELIADEKLRNSLSQEARLSMRAYDERIIVQKFHDVLIS